MMKAPPGKKISPLQAAYVMGYRRAMNKARVDLRDMAAQFDKHLGELSNDYEKVIKEMRREQARYKAIDDALKAKPGEDDVWLNSELQTEPIFAIGITGLFASFCARGCGPIHVRFFGAYIVTD